MIDDHADSELAALTREWTSRLKATALRQHVAHARLDAMQSGAEMSPGTLLSNGWRGSTSAGFRPPTMTTAA